MEAAKLSGNMGELQNRIIVIVIRVSRLDGAGTVSQRLTVAAPDALTPNEHVRDCPLTRDLSQSVLELIAILWETQKCDRCQTAICILLL